MALDPRLSLMGEPVQIQLPDFGRTMLQATQIQQAQLQRQAHEVAMQDMLREREEAQALQAYVRRQMGQGRPASLSQLMPEGEWNTLRRQMGQGRPASLSQLMPEGEWNTLLNQLSPGERPAIHGPAQAPWPGGDTLSPAVVQRMQGGLPGTTYRRADIATPAPGVQAQTVTEVAPGRRQHATTVTSAQGAPRLTEQLDWREMYAASPKQGMALYKSIRDMEQSETDAALTQEVRGVEFLDKARRVITDQNSLDRVRTVMQQHAPGLAGALPQTYTPDAMAQLDQQLTPLKDRMQMLKDRVGIMKDQAGMELDARKYGLDREKLELEAWKTVEGSALDRQKFGLEAQKMGQQAPDYGYGEAVNAAIDADFGDQLRQAGARPTQAMVAQATRRVQEGKVNVSEAQGQGSALKQAAAARLKALDIQGQNAVSTASILDEADRILADPAGFYERGLLDRATRAKYQLGITRNDPKAVNTTQLEQLGSQLVVQGRSLGSGVSEGDRRAYEKAAGDFQSAKTRAEIQSSVLRMRRVLGKVAEDANAQRTEYERSGRFQTFQPSMGQSYSTQDIPAAIEALRSSTGQTYTPAQIEQYWQSLGRTRRD